jgi:hypothetical protein
MIATTRYLFLLASILTTTLASSQGLSAIDTLWTPANFKPAFSRERNHDLINTEQKYIMSSDGRQDNSFTPSSNEEVNFWLNQALLNTVDQLQFSIETDKVFDHRLKVNYLKGLENVLRYYRTNWKSYGSARVNPLELGDILQAYQECMEKDRKNESIESIVDPLPYDAGTVIINAGIFNKNPGYQKCKNELFRKYCGMHLDQAFFLLKDNPDVPFADSLIKVISPMYPRQLYDYAAANNRLGAIIRSIKDNFFVQSVTRMARSRSGQQYFPFLDNIVKGKMTFDDIDAVKDDSLLYYRLLVQTQMSYVERALNKDTAYEFAALTDKLEKKAQSVFVNVINGLHEVDNLAVRFKIIQPLSAEELYYLAVMSDGIIYTSSYTKGVYPLMMKKAGLRGDSLMMRIKFDRYRKFIKMAAGYNTLGNFLNTFPPRKNPGDESDAEKLMRAFVGKLEIGEGLEAGVDVADSYASITESLKPLATEMLRNVQRNFERNRLDNNKRGMVIYNILNKLFLSADTTNSIDLTKELGIPPVYEVPFRNLVNDSGRVIMQVFFYGEKSDQEIFRGFVDMFSNQNWKITASEFWVTITSAKGKPVTIFANRALQEEGGENEKAQKALDDYLEQHELYPTITIHRGHSYTAPYTVEQMSPASKIVFLGSCGGYHLIHDVLAKAEDAHIIASKQIGKTAVNRPFFQLLTEKIRNGNNIDWIPFWGELDKMINVEGFEDYIPPYKNLGALFIKAYKIAMEKEERKGVLEASR